MLLSNPLDVLSKITGGISRTVSGNLPLAALQKSLPVGYTNDSLPSGVVLSFLEWQMNSSLLLQSAEEFKHWLFATVNHLLENGK
jgi:TUP1-like enhancer of split